MPLRARLFAVALRMGGVAMASGKREVTLYEEVEADASATPLASVVMGQPFT